MEVRAWDVGKSEGRPVVGRIRVSMSPGTKVSPRPTGASLRESMENALNGESKNKEVEVVRPPAGAPPPLASPEPGACMLVSQRLFREGSRVDPGSAFEVLEPYAGKLARTVLRGAGGA
jgi:hypothetical protein